MGAVWYRRGTQAPFTRMAIKYSLTRDELAQALHLAATPHGIPRSRADIRTAVNAWLYNYGIQGLLDAPEPADISPEVFHAIDVVFGENGRTS